MENDNSKAYSEVIEILKLIDDEEKLEKLPMEVLEVFKSKMDPNYHPNITKEIPLEEQNLQKETMGILAWISMKYWGNEIEKIDVKEQDDTQPINDTIQNTTENNVVDEEEVKQNDEILRQEINRQIENAGVKLEVDVNSQVPILYKDLKWYEKIRVKIIEFFNRIFKFSKKNVNNG